MKFPYPYLELQGISDQKVLQVIRSLPRELFVHRELWGEAYFAQLYQLIVGKLSRNLNYWRRKIINRSDFFIDQ